MSMTNYLKKIIMLKDMPVGASEQPKDSQVIRISFRGLGAGYESFVTSITTHFDPSMTFLILQHLFMDYNLSLKPTMEIPIEANLVTTSTKVDEHQLSTKAPRKGIMRLTSIIASTSLAILLCTEGNCHRLAWYQKPSQNHRQQ